MARSKQPPMRREASSEFFNKRTATWEDTNGREKTAAAAQPAVTASVNSRAPVSVAEKPDAGVLQLVVAVAGIYASL